MTLYAPGTSVLVGPDHRTPATVLAVSVRGEAQHVSYELAWWDGTQRHTDWLPAHEVHAQDAVADLVLGFTHA